MYQVVKYSTHLWAVKDKSTGELVTEFDAYTGKDETAVFSSVKEAQLWIVNFKIDHNA